MGEGMLAEIGVEMSNAGDSAAEIADDARRAPRGPAGLPRPRDARVPQARRADQRRAGRDRDAAVGQADHRDQDGKVETTERVRTRGKARERLVELLMPRPMERLSILHTTEADVEAFAEELISKRAGLDASKVTIDLVGPSVGPHLGPGCVGGVALYTEALAPGLTSSRPAAGPSGETAPHERCDRVAGRLRAGAAPASARLYSGADHAHWAPCPRSFATTATTATSTSIATSRTRTSTFHDHRERRRAHQRLGRRAAAVRPRRRAAQPRRGHARACCASRAASSPSTSR